MAEVIESESVGSLEDARTVLGAAALPGTVYGYVKVNGVANVGATVTGFSGYVFTVSGGSYTYSHQAGSFTFTATHPPANWTLSKQVTVNSGSYVRCDFNVIV